MEFYIRTVQMGVYKYKDVYVEKYIVRWIGGRVHVSVGMSVPVASRVPHVEPGRSCNRPKSYA
jgi:hypothetical protein